MEYKILEQNGIENENVDGAAFNNFCAGDRDGIIKGILNECSVYSPSSNSIGISTGEIIIKGFRVKITSPYLYNFTSTAGVDIRYHIIARVILSSDRFVTVNIICRPIENLVKDELFKVEQGTYECELVRFTHSPSGITSISRSIGIIAGGQSTGGTSITVDDALSFTSENPVQNKVIAEALGEKTTVTKTDENGNVVKLGTFDSDTKVDKMTSVNNNYHAYGIDNKSNPRQWYVSTSANRRNAGWLVTYRYPNETANAPQSDGVLVTNNPEQPYHCTPRIYVDEAVANVKPKLYKRIITIKHPTNNNNYIIFGYSSTNEYMEFEETEAYATYLNKYYSGLICEIENTSYKIENRYIVSSFYLEDPSGTGEFLALTMLLRGSGAFYLSGWSIEEAITEV